MGQDFSGENFLHPPGLCRLDHQETDRPAAQYGHRFFRANAAQVESVERDPEGFEDGPPTRGNSPGKGMKALIRAIEIFPQRAVGRTRTGETCGGTKVDIPPKTPFALDAGN